MASPFNKTTAPQSAGTKQYAVLGVALLALGGILWHQATHALPRAATAAPVQANPSDDTTAPAVVSNPGDLMSQAIDRLKEDPTAHISLDRDPSLSALEAAPNNPFHISTAWRKDLVKAVPEAPAETAAPQPVAAPVETPVAGTATPFVIQGVIKEGRTRLAIVDGRLLKVGSTTHGVRVLKILDDRILCRPLEPADAAPYEVPLSAETATR